MDEFRASLSTPEGQSDTMIVRLCGSMTIHYGPQIKAALTEALDSAQAILVDLNEVTEMDVIGLQFVCSSHRSATLSGKGFTVSGTHAATVAQTMESAGFSRKFGCLPDGSDCIWAAESRQCGCAP